MTGPEEKPSPRANDIRPLVGSASSNRGIWFFGAVMVLLALLLFVTLESRRTSLTTPALGEAENPSDGQIASPPPLALPLDQGGLAYDPGLTPYPAAPVPVRAPQPAYPLSLYQPERPRPAPAVLDPEMLAAQRMRQNAVSPPARAPGEAAPSGDPFGVGERGGSRKEERVQATPFANPATTVPKGTVIQAVLETALDSTRPGLARAIVSRDIFGFDGTQVLVPRGSRLIGEYKADLQPGQKRALIQWQRLMRPDGAMINLDSPSADPLGRAGVEGKVNSHFFQRFGGSLLQSAVNVGSQVAINQATSGNVIYAIPLPSQSVPVISSEKVQPTIKVRQGTSVSVFVARDLDFTAVSP
ncbi:conjugal transfer protein TrbI [Sphingobium sufflavum]|uniref:TrbI/VirB10 family protein n=1 Tax=Sphingobium sufflavum TaxID=1129547 RepID=UPI001F2FF592|nr:TrbI/VirB10 family protein [Sphingobium sufflavum]MCE7798376.1 conjugal transfer protein TrbI [Sphingobium sufflavum]